MCRLVCNATIPRDWYNCMMILLKWRSNRGSREGTKNEDAVMEALQKETWVKQLYQLGLVEMVSKPHLAVSPDGVAVIKIDGLAGNVMVSVEIAARVSADRQEKATSNELEYSHSVNCFFNDEVFNACVNQAAVLNCDYALYQWK